MKINDVARSKDISHLSDRIDYVEQSLSARIDNVSARIDHVEQRLKGITGTLWVMIGSMVTVSTGIIVMLVQINMNISSL